MFHPSLKRKLETILFTARAEMLDNGFFRFDHFINKRAITVFLNEVDMLARQATANNHYSVLRSAQGDVRFMKRLDNESDLFFDFARHPILLQLAESLLDKPVISLRVDYFASVGKADDRVAIPLHQDQGSFYEHFRREMALSFVIALDEDEKSGVAVEYGQPSPIRLLKHAPSTVLGIEHELASLPRGLNFKQVQIPQGGCAVHHSFAIHRVVENKGNGLWRALILKYRGSPYRAWLRSEAKYGGG
jgi:hypothetical protein